MLKVKAKQRFGRMDFEIVEGREKVEPFLHKNKQSLTEQQLEKVAEMGMTIVVLVEKVIYDEVPYKEWRADHV